MHVPRRNPIHCHGYRKHWRAWQAWHISLQWISRVGSGRSKWCQQSQQYTTFTVGNLGFYEFTRVPFGLCNMPTTFQHLMQNTLGEFNLTYCIIYLDDVIVFGCSEKEHLEHLHVVFKHFWEFNLKLKPSKCSFFQSEIVYLAHHVSREGIHPSRNNVRAIEDFPMPEIHGPSSATPGGMGGIENSEEQDTDDPRVGVLRL